MRKTKPIVCLLWSFISISTGAYAQIESGNPPEILSIYTGAQFYSRTLKGNPGNDEKVHQWVFPLFAAGRWLREDLHVSLSQTLSTAQLEDQPQLSGLENTKLRATYRVFANSLAYLGLSLPLTSGNTEVGTARVRNLLYTEALQFGVNRITEGTDLDIGFAYARPMGNLFLGFGVGYILKGEYDRLSQGTSPGRYDPGNIFSFSVNGQLRRGPTRVYGEILYNRYGDDIQDENRFESGDELTFLTAVTFRLEPLRANLFLADTIKGKSSFEQAELSINNPFDNRLNVGIALIYPLLNERLLLKAGAQTKMFFDDNSENDANVADLSGGFQFFITENLALDISTGLIRGDMKDGQTDISGYSLGFLARYGL